MFDELERFAQALWHCGHASKITIEFPDMQSAKEVEMQLRKSASSLQVVSFVNEKRNLVELNGIKIEFVVKTFG